MGQTRIKICGITRPEDAEAAAHYGADAIGLVFHAPAPRNVTHERARDILDALPPFVTAVGLFVDQPPAVVLESARKLGLSAIQLHGHETPEQVAKLKPYPIFKAIRVIPELFAGHLAHWRNCIDVLGLTNLRGLVLESANTNQAGGSGIENDWAAVKDAYDKRLFEGLPAVIAAGGLKPTNVGQVIRETRPYAVDVSSGVEEMRGIKSASKIKAFIRAVREADRANLTAAKPPEASSNGQARPQAKAAESPTNGQSHPQGKPVEANRLNAASTDAKTTN